MYNRGQMLGLIAATALAEGMGPPIATREPRYDLEPELDRRGHRYVYRDTKPAGPTHEQRKAKRKAQRKARKASRGK